jgi:hypothetical protein
MKLLREPLVHFLLLGVALFGVFAVAGRWTAGEPAANRIVVTPGMVENLKLSFQRSTGSPPEANDLRAAIDAYVREEILCREARALGIDRDDPTVRSLLAQRMEFLAEGSAIVAAASDADLAAYYSRHASEFKKPDGAIPSLAEIRPAVASSWQSEQRQAAARAVYEKMRERYQVKIEMPADPAAKTR